MTRLNEEERQMLEGEKKRISALYEAYQSITFSYPSYN